MTKKKTKPDSFRVKNRIELATDSLDHITEEVESAVRSAKSRIAQLKMLLAEEEKKDLLSFDEVKNIIPKWGREPETVFIGRRKFRVEDEDSKLSVEKTNDRLYF